MESVGPFPYLSAGFKTPQDMTTLSKPLEDDELAGFGIPPIDI